jgi:hypothetical protein
LSSTPVRGRFSLGKRVLRVLIAIVAILGSSLVLTPAAQAASGYSISSGTWNVRSCPGVCGTVATITQGAIPDLVCQVPGPQVSASGFGASAVYDLVRTPNGVLGYISDLGVAPTPYARFDPNLPRCDGAGDSPVPPAASGTGYSWIVSCTYKVIRGQKWACWVAAGKYLFAPING